MEKGSENQPLLQITAPHLKQCCWVRRSNFLLFGTTVLYLSFLMLGAYMFWWLEYPIEMQIRDQLRLLKKEFLEVFPCVSDEGLEDLIEKIILANNRGVSAANNVETEPNWSFGQAFFFSGTVITTIGYGHVTPLSRGGKVFCIVYGLLGIPLTLILLTAYVERLMIPTTWFLQFLNSKFGHLYQSFNIRMVHFATVATAIISLFFLIPAAILSYLEPDWDFLDSIYYCFISLTTIGLGDYIPGEGTDHKLRPLYKVCVTFYLLIGLTFMMLLLAVLYGIPQLNLGIYCLLESDELVGADPKKMGLSRTGGSQKYIQHTDETTTTTGTRHIKASSSGNNL
ncbi:potassium channel subfamily K member 1-like isoform X1 [Limulus polyphemus]|uniref:Potassium channel subfamily K member 1 n=1 Tax=Limulus polyphemus TaxID=6850 RepID=A0ABM1TA40_LIMPO|nr:potassium channel subfamily K member 1-like isoform X1 [Limulus polyphemus]